MSGEKKIKYSPQKCSLFRFGFLIAILILACCTASAFTSARGDQHDSSLGPRIVQDFDRDWTFQYFPQETADAKWADAQANDSAWPAVALPHSWSVYETTHELHPFIEHATEREDSYWWYGWGWYRKRFSLARRFAEKQIFLEFDGVQKVCFVYVNGKLAGEHKGGYTSFSVDITRWVRFDGPNVIAVQVSNRRDDDFGHVPPMTAGNFDVYGGIYRSVRLVLTNKVHIPFQGAADSEGGSFIITPQVSAERGIVHDTIWVRNDATAPADCELHTELRDADGKVLDSQRSSVHLQPGELKSVDQVFAPVAHPHLWSPTTPYLYLMRTEVKERGATVDVYQSNFGMRWFSWNHAEHRLYLNGAPILLNGTNRHQEFPWLGDAMPVWLQQRDLSDMRWNLGHIFQRTAHYPQDPSVYDFCDRNGMLVMEESPNIKNIAFGKDVQKQNMKEMIRRDRNHPSIFFWSIGNETDHPADSAWAWEEDKTRLINLRRGTNGGDHVMTTDEDLALEQTLRCTVRGWYNEDAHKFGEDTAEPVSGQVTSTEEWQHTTDARYIVQHANGNVVVFLYNDHGADRIYKNAPLHYVNPKGWVDAYRFPKYVYYLWQANFTEKPMVFIHPWPWQQKYLGRKKTITVDSNCDTVELLLNGHSLGVQKPEAASGHVVNFDTVEVTQGTLTAVGHKGDKAVQQDLFFPSAPVKLALQVQASSLVADRSGLAILQVDALDAQGHSVPYIHPEITWSVSGEGILVGPANYTTDTDKNGAAAGEMYITLPTANLVRTTNKAGAIEVRVSSPGLASASITLHSQARGPDVEGITEYPLQDAGRHPVVRDASFQLAILSTTPRVFDPITQDYKLPAATIEEAHASVDQFLREHNPKLRPDSVAYKVVLEKLSQLLFQNKGHLIADWYNFSAKQFTDARALSSTVEHSQLPATMKDVLLTDYAQRLIGNGEMIDVQQENKILQQVLPQSRVVQSGSANLLSGIERIHAATLGALLHSAYSDWDRLSAKQQESALQLLYHFNPALKENTGTSSNLERSLSSGPILLPDWKVIAGGNETAHP